MSGRLDKVLADLLNLQGLTFSRTRVKALLDDGAISVETPSGARTIGDATYKVKPGEIYYVVVPPPTPATPIPQAIPLDVIFEDDALIVVNKPAGLVVHPAVTGVWCLRSHELQWR